MRGLHPIARVALRWAPVLLMAAAARLFAEAHEPVAAALACVATLILAVAASVDTPAQRS